MSELIERLRADFADSEYRHSYAEECLNTMIATQIKVLREQREMSQASLAELSGMKQPRIPLLEDSTYSNWTINTLKRFAKAFDVALTVRFDAFSDVVLDFESLSKETLQRPSFKDDPLFSFPKLTTSRRFKRHRRNSVAFNTDIQEAQGNLFKSAANLLTATGTTAAANVICITEPGHRQASIGHMPDAISAALGGK